MQRSLLPLTIAALGASLSFGCNCGLGTPVPAVSIDDVALAEGASGTTTFAFTVSLDQAPAPGSDARVSWATQDGTATAGSDYTAASGELVFQSGGALMQTVIVDVIGDADIEPDESFSVVLDAPVNATIAKATGTGTILSDDLPRASIAAASISEGDSGTVSLTFTVSLDVEPPAGRPVQVDWATSDGTATSAADYEAASGSLTFAAGEGLTKTLNVRVLGDTDIEPDESFSVTLSNPVNVTLGTSSAIGTILADDFPTVSIDSISLAEGDSGTTSFDFQVSVSADPPAGFPLVVHWATADGTATTAGGDYAAASGDLTFAPGGLLTQTVSILVTGDTDLEPDETFTVALSNVGNGTIGTGTATGAIIADDFPTVSIASVSANEGNSGSTAFDFAVTIGAPMPAGYDGTVDYATADGTALAPGDYAAASGTLTFTPGGGTTQTVTVSVAGDTDLEDDETFSVALANPSHLGAAGGPATGTIVSDDPPRASVSDVTVIEGDSGSTAAVFNVTLEGEPLSGRDAQLTWATADGTASMPSDYVPGSGSLTFTRGGPLTQTVIVQVNGDTVSERDEIFSVKLTAVANVALADAAGFATIVDDELPSLTIDDVTLSEGSSGTTPFAFTVTLSRLPDPGQDVQVSYATANRTALAGSDYTAAAGSLTFTSAGPTTATFTVDVLGDTSAESQEEFAVVLSGVTNARIRDNTGLGTILDDEGTVIFVDPTSDAGTLDGLSWASAFHTVQEGVDRASALGGGQVWVAAARYTNGGGTATVLTLRSRVSVIGGFGGYQGGSGPQESSYGARDPDANVTLLDGAGTAYHVLAGANEAVLDGFTVTGGRANYTGSTSSTDPNRRGAGMDVYGVSPTIARCTFIDNAALGWGGALYMARGTQPSIRPLVHDSRFINNTAVQGGGFYSNYADVDVLDSTFESNTAGGSSDGYGGGFVDRGGRGTIARSRFAHNFAFYGGGGEGVGSYLTLRECDFVNNRAYNASWGLGQGGGFYDNLGNTRIFDSAFMSNSAEGSSGGAGGLYLRDSSTLVVRSRVENNVGALGAGVHNWNSFGGVQHFYQTRIANNRSSWMGGGVFSAAASPVFVDCVIEGNTSTGSGGGMYNQGAATKLVSTTLFNNLSPNGPEIYNAVRGGSTPLYTSATAANTILFNRTLNGQPAVVTEAGCSFTTTQVSSTDAGDDAQFLHIPLRSNWINSGSTTTTLLVTNATTYFATGDVIEIADDGVPRLVTAATSTQLTISPALDVAPQRASRVDNWGPGTTDVAVDLRLAPTSPCIDSGSNPAMLPDGADLGDLDGDADTVEAVPFDYAGNPRFLDDPLAADTGVGPAPIVDIGAFERVP